MAMLSKPYGSRLLSGIEEQIDILLSTNTFKQSCFDSDVLTWQETKDFSKEGFTYRKGRSYDEGNYCYSVILTWMYKKATGMARTALDVLFKAYPGLLPFDGHNPYNMWVLQGDFIECKLASARQKGPAVEEYFIQDRHRFAGAVVSFSDDFTELIQCLCGTYIPVRKRIATQTLVDIMMAELERRENHRPVVKTKAKTRHSSVASSSDDFDELVEIDPECTTAMEIDPVWTIACSIERPSQFSFPNGWDRLCTLYKEK